MRTLVSALLPLSFAAVTASQLDTLRTFGENGGAYHYTSPSIVLQAARFDLPHVAAIKTLTVVLGGSSSNGEATVHIYGDEGGLASPMREHDLIQPIKIQKSRSGYERITIDLPRPLLINSSQFFIGVSDLDSGVTLLTDRVERKPACSDPSAGSYFYQAIKLRSGEWQQGPFAYLVEVEISFDLTEAVFIRDTNAVVYNEKCSIRPFSTPSIACADLNEDSYIDVLANGRLYFNNGFGVFLEKTRDAGLPAHSTAHVLLDINNDGRTDILLLNCDDKSKSGSTVYLNNGASNFTPYSIEIPPVIDVASISIADIDNDGFPDLFIGQSSNSTASAGGNILLRNTGNLTFEDKSGLITGEGRATGVCRASSFIDYDNDGNTDLYIANYYNQPDELWLNNGNGTFRYTAVDPNPGGDAASSNGCHWGDVDQDGDMDVLIPLYIPPSNIYSNSSAAVLFNEQFRGDSRISQQSGIVYEERYSGGAWGDINNDGLLDFIVATSCPCRYADVYLQNSTRNFTLATHELGLDGLANNTDAVWADIDNNGSLDLLLISNDSLVVYRQKKSDGNYIQIDARSRYGNRSAVGSTIEVYVKNKVYTHQVTSGRGRLMQDPTRLHFGLGTATAVDSVRVQWPGNTMKETFTDIAINGVSTVTEGSGSTSAYGRKAISNITAFPNPSDGDVTIAFDVEESGLLTIEIVNIQGITQYRLTQDQAEPGPFRVQWNGMNINGQKVSSGMYTYTIHLNDQHYSGKVTVVD